MTILLGKVMAVNTKTHQQRFQENTLFIGFDSYQVPENTFMDLI